MNIKTAFYAFYHCKPLFSFMIFLLLYIVYAINVSRSKCEKSLQILKREWVQYCKINFISLHSRTVLNIQCELPMRKKKIVLLN